jgi:hypothetical protein
MSGSDDNYCEDVISCSVDTTVVKELLLQKGPYYFGIKVFNQGCFKKFSSYKFILLIGGTFCFKFQ